jgi:hypothetical protein
MIQTEDWGNGDEQQAAPAPQKPAPKTAPQAQQTALQPVPTEQPETTSEFPNDLKTSMALLQQAQHEWDNAPLLPLHRGLKGQTQSDGVILGIRRAALQKLKRIRDHFFKLQQGLPVFNVTADHQAQAEAGKRNLRVTRAARLQELAATNPEVAKMLSK